MAFVEEGGAKKYKKYEDMEPGETVVEGWFLRSVPGNYLHPNYEFREKDSGEIFVANGCGSLKKKMEDAVVRPGDYIRLVYQGKDIMREGRFKGKAAHNIKLFRDRTLFSAEVAEGYAPSEVAAPAEETSSKSSKAPKAPRVPKFEEEKELTPAERRKRFSDSLPVEDEDEDCFI